jgi:hypothetical protein
VPFVDLALGTDYLQRMFIFASPEK